MDRTARETISRIQIDGHTRSRSIGDPLTISPEKSPVEKLLISGLKGSIE